ncbi:MAG: carboxypeptidase regulatory-like domain-containing protein [Terriglobia bacterium]
MSALAGTPQTQDLKGEVLNEAGKPLVGAVCTLTGGPLPDTGLSVATGEKGEFNFTGLLPSTYRLTCAAADYEPVMKQDLQIGETPPPFVQMVLPPEIVIRQKVEVREKAPVTSPENISAPAKVTSIQLMTLPLTEQRFKAALPLVPGVVRTPDGKINIKGVAESQGMMLVDGAETVDPVTGAFAIEVPIDAVGSVDVFKTAYQAEYGRFAGGLASVQTKAPSDQFHFELNDLTPNMRGKSDHLVGISEESPRIDVTGPLLRGKLDFFEAFNYDLHKQPVRGLAWPKNEIKKEGIDSFTSLQYIISTQHLLTGNLKVFPARLEFADINSLVPQSASSNYGQRGFSGGVKDRYLFPAGGILTSFLQLTNFSSYAHGQGPLDMLVTPNGWGGNFFNTWARDGSQQEASQTYQFPRKEWRGGHEFMVGGDLVHRSFSGSSVSRPVQVLRQDGTLAEQIDFQGKGQLSARDTEVAAFVQDHWAIQDRLAIDLGLRYSGQTAGDPTAFAPRIGAVYSPGRGGKTILRGGIGVFYDRLPLLASDFTDNPTRVVTYYDTQGNPLGPPLVFQNVYARTERRITQFVPPGHDLDSTPYNVTWNVEADREIHPHVNLRLSYLSSGTHKVFITNPLIDQNGVPLLELSNTGASRYHEFESTLRIRARANTDINISYVHSLSHGDLNGLGDVYVPFEEPVIRPNFYASLPSNVPDRFVTWGRFNLPWKIVASPVLDIHSGFPYSDLNELQRYVGYPDSLRFPTFISLDLEMYKEFRIPFLPWVRNHTLRGILRVYNVTNHQNPRDVYNNVTSPYFGHFVGFQHRFPDPALSFVY